MGCLPSINWWFGFRWPIHSMLQQSVLKRFMCVFATFPKKITVHGICKNGVPLEKGTENWCGVLLIPRITQAKHWIDNPKLWVHEIAAIPDSSSSVCSLQEKVHIATTHLLPKQRRNLGWTRNWVINSREVDTIGYTILGYIGIYWNIRDRIY